jgi:hypothetical protein
MRSWLLSTLHCPPQHASPQLQAAVLNKLVVEQVQAAALKSLLQLVALATAQAVALKSLLAILVQATAQ